MARCAQTSALRKPTEGLKVKCLGGVGVESGQGGAGWKDKCCICIATHGWLRGGDLEGHRITPTWAPTINVVCGGAGSVHGRCDLGGVAAEVRAGGNGRE